MIDLNREGQPSESDRREIIEEYARGQNIKRVHSLFPQFLRRQIAKVLHESSQIKPRDERRDDDPSPEEIARLALLTRDSWSPEEAGSRWVGRVASRYEQAGHYLSKLLRD